MPPDLLPPGFSLQRHVQAILSQAHMGSPLGRLLESPGEDNVAIDTTRPEGVAEAVQFLLHEAEALETALLRVAAEADALRGI